MAQAALSQHKIQSAFSEFDNYPNADILLSTGTFWVSQTIEAVNYQESIIYIQAVFLTSSAFYPIDNGNVNDWPVNNIKLKIDTTTRDILPRVNLQY